MRILKNIWKEIAVGFAFLWLKYTFIIAKRDANRRHFLDGKTYWVIRLSWSYRVYSTLDIKELKKRGFFRKDLDHIRLSEIAVYCTTEIKRR